MDRAIVSFHQDTESHWVAELACGHRRHTRHDPPLSERPWVLTQEGRQSRIGAQIDCVRCDRKEIPAGHERYRQTPVFSERSVPEGLLRNHTTKAGIWALVRVTEGSIDYHLHAPFGTCEHLTPSAPGIVPPEVEHHLAPSGPVSFFVEFWRSARAGP